MIISWPNFVHKQYAESWYGVVAHFITMGQVHVYFLHYSTARSECDHNIKTSHWLTMNITCSKMFYYRTFEFLCPWHEDLRWSSREMVGCTVWDVGTGCLPPHWEKGLGRRLCCLSIIYLNIDLQTETFGAFWVLFFSQFSWFFTLKLTSYRCWNEWRFYWMRWVNEAKNNWLLEVKLFWSFHSTFCLDSTLKLIPVY